MGWARADDRDFYVRQLSELKGGAAQEDLETLPNYCGLCGWAAGAGARQIGDAAAIKGYCGKSNALDEAISKFAISCTKQTEADYEALAKAKRAGRVKVVIETSH